MSTASPCKTFKTVLVPPVPRFHSTRASTLRRHKTDAPATPPSTSTQHATPARASSEPPLPSSDADQDKPSSRAGTAKLESISLASLASGTTRTLSNHPRAEEATSPAPQAPSQQEQHARVLRKRPRMPSSEPIQAPVEGAPSAGFDEEIPDNQENGPADKSLELDEQEVPTPPGKKLRIPPPAPRRPLPPLASRPGLKASPASRKPFKRPTVSSPADKTASTTDGEESESAKRSRLVKRIKELEEDKRVFEEATRILDGRLTEKLVEETKMWRDAGRKAATMLFERYGHPSTLCPTMTSTSWSYQDSFLDQHWPVDGDEEDDEGRDLPDLDEELERVRNVKRYGKGKSKEAASSEGEGFGEGEKPWNIGTMMERMGYRPEILGWNQDEEDWADD